MKAENEAKAIIKKNFGLELEEQMSIERTKLSNERTFLSYLRTCLTLLGAGLTIIRLDALEKIYDVGMAAIILSPVIMAFGIYRFANIKKRLGRFAKKK